MSQVVRDAFATLQDAQCDLIIANDINTLPLAIQLAEIHKAKVLIDAHEYTPRDFDDKWFFRFFFQNYWDWICRKYLPRADAVITVSAGIAEEYKRNYHVACTVISNAPFFENLTPSPIDNDRIRIIHHGSLHPSRKLENMISLMDLLDDRYYLEFMLASNDSSYYRYLRNLAKKNQKISFREPVPMTMISKTINEYDIGLYLLWPGAFSKRMALPNKIFEFIQGRLCIAIWPSPEMAKIVKEYEVGIVSDYFSIESIADMLNALSRDDVMRYKMNAHNASNHFFAERNREIFLALLNPLIRDV